MAMPAPGFLSRDSGLTPVDWEVYVAALTARGQAKNDIFCLVSTVHVKVRNFLPPLSVSSGLPPPGTKNHPAGMCSVLRDRCQRPILLMKRQGLAGVDQLVLAPR